MNSELGLDRRTLVSKTVLALSSIVVSVSVLAYAVLQASFRTWAVGRFTAGHGELLINAFLILAAASLLSLLGSAFGKGRQRWIAVALSLLTLTIDCVVLTDVVR